MTKLKNLHEIMLLLGSLKINIFKHQVIKILFENKAMIKESENDFITAKDILEMIKAHYIQRVDGYLDYNQIRMAICIFLIF